MTNKLFSIKFTDTNRPSLIKTLKSAILISAFSINATFAQDADITTQHFQKLYDCGSYYSLINRCYSSNKSKDSHRLSVLAFDNRDKIIHIIYVEGKQSGILPETNSSGMKSSIEEMIKLTDGQCQNVLKLQPTLGLSCDKIIEELPRQSYDKGNKSGNVRSLVPIPIG